MVKIKFYFSNQFKTLECNPNTKMKFIFEKWAQEMGKEYKIIGESIVGGKIVYEYNFKFRSFTNKLLNPELTLNQQLSIKEPTIIVKEIKLNEINLEELKTEIFEEIKSPKDNPTFDKAQEQIVQFGFLIEKEIEEELKKNPENFLDIKDALKQKDTNNQMYVLGKLGESLEKIGIKVAIDKRNSKDKENIINNQFLSSGLINQSKYEVHLKEDEKTNMNKILYDSIEKNQFISKWKNIFSSELKIPEDKIFITNIRKGSIVFDVVFKTLPFKDMIDSVNTKININEKIENFIDSHPEILSIYQKNIMGACKLTLDMLDSRGNQSPNKWAKKGSKRAGIEYHPPDNNWIGFGLKVLGEYDNDDWIDCHNNPNEWAVAYHGTSEKAVKPICSKNGKFWSTEEEGAKRQKCKNCLNKNSESKAKYNICGEGSYCSPFLDYAEKYSSGVIFMCRVNPKEYRIPEGKYEENEWITDGTRNSIRPYRLLYKINK